jgi:hypothetical protein
MAQILRLPPRIKILEALGAVADGRIKILDEYRAQVVSSEGDRTYDVYVDLSRKIVDSSDNGTVFRGYIGYPIISVLMIKRVLPYNERLAEGLKGIRWRELNERYKSYALVEKLIKEQLARKGFSLEEIDRYVDEVMKSLEKIRLYREKIV